MSKKCEHCGAPMPDEAQFCLSCFTAYGESAINDDNNKKLGGFTWLKSKLYGINKKRFALIATALLSVVLIIGFSLYSKSDAIRLTDKPSNKIAVSSTTNDDGSVITTYDDGSVETKTSDGTTITEEVDGTVVTETPDGTVVTEKTDGTVVTKKTNGTVVTEKADGTVETKNPDGTTKTQKPNGTVETTTTTTKPTSPSTSEPTTENTTDKTTEKSTITTAKTTHIEYRYRDESFTTSSDSSMNGWILYETTYSWSDYGSWSNWSTDSFSSSESRQVESRTTYRYCAFKCTNCGNRDPYSTPCDNCKTSEYFEYWELWYTTKGNSMSKGTLPTVPDKYYVSINGDRWWFERDGYSDGQGGIGQPSRKEYRYRDRKQIATYHFYKWSDWSEWGTDPVTGSDTREVETRKVN